MKQWHVLICSVLFRSVLICCLSLLLFWKSCPAMDSIGEVSLLCLCYVNSFWIIYFQSMLPHVKKRSDGNTAKICVGSRKMLPRIHWDRIRTEQINSALTARELGHYSNGIRSIEYQFHVYIYNDSRLEFDHQVSRVHLSTGIATLNCLDIKIHMSFLWGAFFHEVISQCLFQYMRYSFVIVFHAFFISGA